MRRVSAILTALAIALALMTARAEPPRPDQGITAGWTTHANADRATMLRAQGHTLWAGTEGGGLIGWNTQDGTFIQRLYPQGKLAGNTITAMALAPNGDLWVATRGGVSRFTPDGIGRNFTIKNTSQRGPQKATVQEERSVNADRIPVDLPSEEAARAAFDPGYLMFGTDPTIYFYRGWDTTQNAVVISPGLRRPVAPGTPVYAVHVGLAADNVRDVAVEPGGRVWISTVNGVNAFQDDTWTVFTVWNSELAHSDAYSLAVDGAGRVWVSHGALGIFSMYDGNWRVYQIQGAIQDLAVDPDGTVWAATSPVCDATGVCVGGGVWSFDGQQWRQRYTEADGIASDTVTTIAFDHAGNMWLGHELTTPVRRLAVSHRTADGWRTYDTVQQAIETDFAAILAGGSSNDLWAVAGGRVWTQHLGAVRGYDGTDWQALYTGTRILNSNLITALAADDLGRVWVGTWPMWDGKRNVGGGVNLWNGASWSHFTQENSGLASNLLAAIAVGQDDRLWIQTAQGQLQAYHDGLWTSYASREELVQAEYAAIVAAADLAAVNEERLWMVDAQQRVWIWGTGARSYRPSDGWEVYTFENTSRKADEPVAMLRLPASAMDNVILTNLADNATAQAFFPTGYLMIGDDPTLYRYEAFLPDFRAIQVSPLLQRDLPAGTPIYPVELGLLSTTVSDVVISHDGRIWFAATPARLGATPLYGGIAVLDPDSGEWTHFTLRNTSYRGPQVGSVSANARAGDREVTVTFLGGRAADEAFASGYVMFEGDPTLYTYQGFSNGKISVVPWFTSPLERVGVGLQQDLPAGTAVYAVIVELGGDKITHLALDSDGNVWAAIHEVGVSRFDGESWTLYRLGENGMPRRPAASLLTWGREVWIITDGNGVGRFSSGAWQTYDVFNSGLVDDRIRAIAITPSGEVWLGTDDGGISVFTLPGFQLRSGSSAVLVEPGSSAAVWLEVIAGGGFEGAITLAAEGAPPGVEVSFDPPALWTSGSVRMTVSVAPEAVPGAYVLTITARSDTGLTSSRQLNLYIVPELKRAYLPLAAR